MIPWFIAVQDVKLLPMVSVYGANGWEWTQIRSNWNVTQPIDVYLQLVWTSVSDDSHPVRPFIKVPRWPVISSFLLIATTITLTQGGLRPISITLISNIWMSLKPEGVNGRAGPSECQTKVRGILSNQMFPLICVYLPYIYCLVSIWLEPLDI